jgi:UDP:flavonoid glycosyltransferase YjiC (YdhE family)
MGFMAEGHDVVLCGPPDFEAIARASGLDYHVVGASVRDYLTRIASAVAGNPLAILREMMNYLDDALRTQLEEVPRAAAGADYIFAAGVQAGGAAAAEIHQIPYRYIAYCPVMFPSCDYAPALLPAHSRSRMLNRLAWWLLHPVFTGAIRFKLNRQRTPLGLPKLRDAYTHILSNRPILASDRELGRPGDDCPIEVQQIRGLHPIDTSPLPEKLQAFLDSGAAPVYIGFGSMTDPAPAETTRAVLDAVAHVGCRAVISEGWAGLGEGPLPDDVFVTGPVPHGSLFPRCALIVHHGGAGTTSSAARAGVPQLIVPHLIDQFYWTGQVHLLGVGPPALRRNKLRADRLADRIEATLGNEWMAERARELAERITALGPTTPRLEDLL